MHLGRKIIPRLASPKRSPKLQPRSQNGSNPSQTEIKDYGMIDQQPHYPPHHASNISTRIPSTSSKIPGSGNGPARPSRIPGSSLPSPAIPAAAASESNKIGTVSNKVGNVSNKIGAEDVPQGCAVRPTNSSAASATSENDESTAQMTASFHSRTKSLPRTKRREDGSPGRVSKIQ